MKIYCMRHFFNCSISFSSLFCIERLMTTTFHKYFFLFSFDYTLKSNGHDFLKTKINSKKKNKKNGKIFIFMRLKWKQNKNSNCNLFQQFFFSLMLNHLETFKQFQSNKIIHQLFGSSHYR